MQELGELQRHSAEFKQRGVRIVAVSADERSDTEETQQRFPNLTILSDPCRQMIAAFQAIHAGQGPDGADVAAPTTLLLDRAGVIRHYYRPARVIERLSAEELRQAVERYLPSQ